MLVSTTAAAAAATALGDTLPTGCNHYSATVDGKTFNYTVRESALSGLAEQARALNVKAAGYASVDVWSVVYRAPGLSARSPWSAPMRPRRASKDLAQDAYAHAAAP